MLNAVKDNAGTILAMDKITGKEGSEYKAEQKSFDSCEFLNASTNVSGKLSRSVSYAFYVYKSPNAPVPEVPSNNEDDNKGIVTVIAIILGACFLIFLGVIDLKIPGSFILSFAAFVVVFGKSGLVPYLTGNSTSFFDLQYLCAQLSGGGLMLGAFFMATDYTTRPITKKGQYLYGILLGVLTGIFRIFGPGAEGVSYAILLGNLVVPLIEKITMPKAFGKGGERA